MNPVNIQLASVKKYAGLNSSLQSVGGSSNCRDSSDPTEATKNRIARLLKVNQPPKEPSGRTFRRPSASSVWIRVEIPKERVYDIDNDSFERLLRLYNITEKSEKGPLECVGYASTSLRLCTVCKDSGKSRIRKDRYYVYKEEKAHSRTIECRGCLGLRLKSLDFRDQDPPR